MFVFVVTILINNTKIKNKKSCKLVICNDDKILGQKLNKEKFVIANENLMKNRKPRATKIDTHATDFHLEILPKV